MKYVTILLSVISGFFLFEYTVYANTDDNLLVNGTFDSDVWDEESWYFSDVDWETVDIKQEGVENNQALNYYFQPNSGEDNSFRIYQEVTLSKGEYLLTAESMGGNEAVVQLFAGERLGPNVATTEWLN